MEWIETNGVVLRYELSGRGRVPLVLIHELGGSLEFWDPVLPAFQQAFRVLRYDLRGFGMSEKVKTLRLDHLLLSKNLVRKLKAGGVDREVRGEEGASDHAPVWIELSL